MLFVKKSFTEEPIYTKLLILSTLHLNEIIVINSFLFIKIVCQTYFTLYSMTQVNFQVTSILIFLKLHMLLLAHKDYPFRKAPSD